MSKVFVATLGAAIFLAACSKPEPPQEPIRAVRVMTVGLDSLQAGHEYAGEVRPRIESRLGFRVAGKITQRQAEVGQHVKAGDVLAQLDPQDYRLAVDAVRAQVASAQTNLELAQADYKRFKELKDQNFISGAELDRRESALKSAKATLEQAQSQLASQGNQVQYTRLVADVSGIVTGVEAEPGQVVAAGTPVFRIAQDGARDVVFSVPEDKLASVRVGTTLDGRQWSAPGMWTAVVREVGASADTATRTYPVKATIPSGVVLPLGATVYVSPKGATAGAQVIKLPTSALKQDGNKSAVWVLDTATMTVRSQTVEIATADGNDAVIASGLKPGMKVVSAGVHVLSPGQKVTIYQEKSPQMQAGSAQAAIKNVANPVSVPGAAAPLASPSK